MIKNVIIPLDFSDCSLNALKYGLRIIERLNIEKLYIMHSLVVPMAISDGVIIDTETDINESEKFIADRYDNIKNDFPQLEKVNNELLVERGTVTDAIRNISKEKAVDLIIMGTKGASGIDEIIMGTNANAVVQSAVAPVLIVPENAKYSSLDHIGLASDYRAIEPDTLDTFKELVQKNGSKIHILHTGKDSILNEEERVEARKFEQYLKNIQHDYHFIKSNHVQEGVEQYVNENGLKMITLIPRKHKFFKLLFEGGESRKFIYHTEVPILALPEK